MKSASGEQANQIAEYYASRSRKEMADLIRRPSKEAEQISRALESSFVIAAASTTLAFDTLSDIEKSFPAKGGDEENARYALLGCCADYCFESCHSSIYQLALGLHGGSMATARVAIEMAIVFSYLKQNFDDIKLFDRFVRYGAVQAEAQSSSLLKHTDFSVIDKQKFAEDKHTKFEKLTAEMTKRHKNDYGWALEGIDDKSRIGIEYLAGATGLSYLMPCFKIFNSAAHGLPEYLLRARKLWRQNPVDSATTILVPILEAQNAVASQLALLSSEFGSDLTAEKVLAIDILSKASRVALAQESPSFSTV